MKYFSIYPSPDGLAVLALGDFPDFDNAAQADLDAFTPGLREESIWIADSQDLLNLKSSIAQLGL